VSAPGDVNCRLREPIRVAWHVHGGRPPPVYLLQGDSYVAKVGVLRPRRQFARRHWIVGCQPSDRWMRIRSWIFAGVSLAQVTKDD
jgi:hypothetical protein